MITKNDELELFQQGYRIKTIWFNGSPNTVFRGMHVTPDDKLASLQAAPTGIEEMYELETVK